MFFPFPFQLVALRYSLRLSWLKALLSHIDSDTREAASRLIGLSCSSLSCVAASDLISELVSLISRNQKIRFVREYQPLVLVFPCKCRSLLLSFKSGNVADLKHYMVQYVPLDM